MEQKRNYLAIISQPLSQKMGSERWVIIDRHSREILDNADGYGYKTAPSAYRGYAFKHKPSKRP